MRRFDDKVVLVTGASAGIGRATVERLASEGASLFCVDVQAETLEHAVKAVAELGVEVQAQVCDVSDARQVKATVQACVDRFGRIDSLCNIAGILRMEHTLDVSLEDWSRILSVNLTGTFLMCQAALPHLLASRGNIVNTSSISALAGMPYGAAYASSKGGVLALTHALAVEFGRRGVRVNAVCPGSISTAMMTDVSLPEGADPRLIQRIGPLKRPRGPETVASVIALLASEDGAHLNGEHIRIDDGTLA